MLDEGLEFERVRSALVPDRPNVIGGDARDFVQHATVGQLCGSDDLPRSPVPVFGERLNGEIRARVAAHHPHVVGGQGVHPVDVVVPRRRGLDGTPRRSIPVLGVIGRWIVRAIGRSDCPHVVGRDRVHAKGDEADDGAGLVCGPGCAVPVGEQRLIEVQGPVVVVAHRPKVSGGHAIDPVQEAAVAQWGGTGHRVPNAPIPM